MHYIFMLKNAPPSVLKFVKYFIIKTIVNEKIIQQIKMNNPQSGEKQIILFFKDFDSVV